MARHRRLVPGVLLAASTLFGGGTAVAADGAAIARGNTVYQYWCATCHGPGIGILGLPMLPGTMALATKYRGALPALLEERTDLTPDFVKTIVRHGITIMPQFRKTEVSDADLDAIAAYLTRKNK
jgi:mono/diheme cytochrome c family protein